MDAKSRRINRNIVECKDNEETKKLCEERVLIETSWNVKRGIIASGPSSPTRINRNIVECKGMM